MLYQPHSAELMLSSGAACPVACDLFTFKRKISSTGTSVFQSLAKRHFYDENLYTSDSAQESTGTFLDSKHWLHLLYILRK